MRGAFSAMEDSGFPSEAIKAVRDAFDCNLYFFEKSVSEGAMFAVLGGSTAVLVLVYILFNILSKKES